MLLRHPFAPRDVEHTVTPHRFPALLADVVVLLVTLALFTLIARVGAGAFVRFVPPHEVPTVSLDPRFLFYYTARSTLRMFLALGASLLFSVLYGYIAVTSRRAERVLIPLLDVLQSVPVLGFLSITVTGFIALFPGSLLGLELASIFAIFTSQAWNMTFAFYQSLRTVPRELDEAVTLYRLPRWQRFLRLEVPAATIGLLWNAMMSFGGGWFFVAASEAISVLNQSYTLPGIGSYVTTAVEAQDIHALLWALAAMAVVIILVDQLFWRPLVAWGDRFKLEHSAAAEVPQSWVLDLLRSARLPHLLASIVAPVRETLSTICARLFPARAPRRTRASDNRHDDRLYDALLVILAMGLGVWGVHFILTEVGLGEMGQVLLMGLATFARVVLLVILSTVIWVPIGVTIGFTPRLARLLQPVVQFLASFPANFLFPFATMIFLNVGLSLNIGGIVLMSLGAQWYILFNTIAGAMSIPNDLREMTRNLGVRGWRLWQSLIIPGIFAAWVTGGITASGGAWNASIVAEIVTWGNTTLTAYGLGAYIASATKEGDWPRIVLGVGFMCVFVVGLNRCFWRRLYQLAETKYRLG